MLEEVEMDVLFRDARMHEAEAKETYQAMDAEYVHVHVSNASDCAR